MHEKGFGETTVKSSQTLLTKLLINYISQDINIIIDENLRLD